jgi:hypothetical protein
MWTPAALSSEADPYRGEVWRLVESQSGASTMRITDSLDEQRLLEDLIEEVKPPCPPDCDDLHFLLKTPFRYAPYPHGSRFRRAAQREGAFYAAEQVETAAAELAFHRLLFFIESPGTILPGRPVEHTAFSTLVVTPRSLDLTVPPLDQDRALWEHPTDYGPCQSLADTARQAGIGALRYRSVRDQRHRSNIALLTVKAFASSTPRRQQTWHIFLRPNTVQVWREFPDAAFEFALGDFALDPRIAAVTSAIPTSAIGRHDQPNRSR